MYIQFYKQYSLSNEPILIYKQEIIFLKYGFLRKNKDKRYVNSN